MRLEPTKTVYSDSFKRYLILNIVIFCRRETFASILNIVIFCRRETFTTHEKSKKKCDEGLHVYEQKMVA